MSSEVVMFERLDATVVATVTEPVLRGGFGSAVADAVLSKSAGGGAVLDLQNVHLIDSMCLGALVSLHRRMAGLGATLAIVNPSSDIAGMFRVTQLDKVLPVCRDVLAAVDLVSGKRAESA